MNKNKIKNLLKYNKKGITIISLIITIIILLILAGTSIFTLTEKDGIITKAAYSKFSSDIISLDEQIKLKSYESNSYYSGSINDFLNINSAYNNKLIIEDNELKYISSNVSNKEKDWLEELSIKKASDYYTIDFDSFDKTTKIDSQFVQSGKKVKQPNPPQKDGYAFLGWYYLKQTGNEDNITYEEIEFDFNIKVFNNYSLYAKYSKEAIMMNCNSNEKFWIYKDKINNVSFKKGSIPNNLPELSWNVKDNNNCADIIAYLDNNTQGGYDLTIISPETIYANANSSSYFTDFSELQTINFDNFDTSRVKTMHWMFNNCKELKNLDLSHFDTSNITNMQRMFSSCKNLENLSLSSFDTTKVTNMYSMFLNCSSLRNIDLTTFDTSNVTNMANMFNGCTNLSILNLTSFNTANVTNMNSMFYNCLSLTDLNLESFNTLNVTNMRKYVLFL